LIKSSGEFLSFDSSRRIGIEMAKHSLPIFDVLPKTFKFYFEKNASKKTSIRGTMIESLPSKAIVPVLSVSNMFINSLTVSISKGDQSLQKSKSQSNVIESVQKFDLPISIPDLPIHESLL
jgi:hypothetical protein